MKDFIHNAVVGLGVMFGVLLVVMGLAQGFIGLIASIATVVSVGGFVSLAKRVIK